VCSRVRADEGAGCSKLADETGAADGGPAAVVFEVSPDGFGRRLGGEDPNWYEDGKEAGRGVLVSVAKWLMERETCPMT
jgi:hypothetical protein